MAKAAPKVAEKDPPVVQAETPAAKPQVTESKPPEPAPQTKTGDKYVAQKILKISELKTWTGYQLTYVDHTTGTPDTIQVIIDDGIAETTPAKSEPGVLNAAKLPRTDCKVMAREKDVLNLRKKMLTIANEQEMVEMAMKDLRGKCFTVEQLQNLSYVFCDRPGPAQFI